MPLVWQSEFESPITQSDVYQVLRRWLARRAVAVALPSELSEGEWVGATSGVRVATLVESAEHGTLFSLRAETPIHDQGLLWITEVTTSSHAGATTTIRVRLSQDSLPGALPRFDRVSVAAPSFIRELLAVTSGADPSPNVMTVETDADAALLIGTLTDPSRRSLLIVISVDNWTRRFLVSPGDVLDRVLGVATVAIVSKEVSLSLPALMERAGAPPARAKQWGVYDGAVRVFRPQCDLRESSPFDHPLFLPDAVRRHDFVIDLQEWALRHSTLRKGEDRTTFDAIRSARLRSQLVNVKDVATYEAILNDVERERDTALQMLDEETARANKAEDDLRRVQWDLEQVRQAARADADDTFVSDGAMQVLHYYASDNSRRPALDFVDALKPQDAAVARAALADLPMVLRDGGRKLVEKLPDKNARRTVYEYRVNTKDLWLRFFFARSDVFSELLVLSGYVKKTNALDPSEIERARKNLERAREQGWK